MDGTRHDLNGTGHTLLPHPNARGLPKGPGKDACRITVRDAVGPVAESRNARLHAGSVRA